MKDGLTAAARVQELVDIQSMDVRNAAGSDDTKKIIGHPESQFIVNDASLSRIPVDQKSNAAEGEDVQSTQGPDSSHIASGPANVKDESPDSVALPVKLNSAVNNPVMKEVVSCASDGNLDSQTSVAPKQGISDVISDKRELLGEETGLDNELGTLPDNVDTVTVSLSHDTSDGRELLSGADVTAVGDAVTCADVTAVGGLTCADASTVAGRERVVVKTSSFDDTDLLVGKSTNESRLEDVDKEDRRSLEHNIVDQVSGSVLLEIKDQRTTETRLEEVSEDDDVKRQQKNKKKRFGKRNKFARLTKGSKNTDLIRQTTNMDIEDGTFDALEVARLVAKEVEREVVNYEEQSGSSSSYSYSSSSSSSERISSGVIRQPDSPKSINVEQDLQINGPMSELRTMENVSPEASEKKPLNSSATAEMTPENNLQEMETSQLTDAAREPGTNSEKEKGFLQFDLNQEFSSEDLDQNQVDAVSNPVSVVSASRAVVAPGMQAGPLKFEGSLGWKGSAATSAFRPASPRRTSDSDIALSGGGTSSGSRQRHDFLDIDLNVAEGGDDKVVNHMPGKEKQALPGLASGESSVELSSKQSERLKFDLNQTEEDGSAPPSQWHMGGCLFVPQKSRRSPSPASSSSCIQPATRNFDLNDNPSNGNDPSEVQPFMWGSSSSSKINPYGGHQEESSISILGTKVNKNTFPLQMPLPFQNGRAAESLMDANLFRGGPLMGLGPAVQYPQHMYGYNGLAMGPAGSFSSAPLYGPPGPIPYMFDTRGAPFIPQMVGAPSAVPSSYCQPSLVMNMMGATPAPNVAIQLRPSMDLNSGYAVDVGNRDPAFFRQLFIPGQAQNRPLDDQLSFRPLSSGASSGKRKEPDSGWELFPTNYKHQQPPHL